MKQHEDERLHFRVAELYAMVLALRDLALVRDVDIEDQSTPSAARDPDLAKNAMAYEAGLPTAQHAAQVRPTVCGRQ